MDRLDTTPIGPPPPPGVPPRPAAGLGGTRGDPDRARHEPADATRSTARADRHETSPLTAREVEVIVLLAKGLTDKAIAEHLVLSVHGVRSHLARIRDKTGRRRRADLTRLAIELSNPASSDDAPGLGAISVMRSTGPIRPTAPTPEPRKEGMSMGAPAGGWTCGHCGHSNRNATSKCENCGNKR